jgi:glycosyltransferase involved in cell wall biosynthesis
MATGFSASTIATPDTDVAQNGAATPACEIAVGLLTGGFDRPYAFGLAMALVARGALLDVVGSKEVDSPEMHTTPRLNFLELHSDPRQKISLATKLGRLVIFYLQLFRYAASAKPTIFHILWNNKVQFFDRTFLMLYYKLLGKKIVLTAHNVNAGKRDDRDSIFNRLTLRAQYRLVDHIFVHTELMKRELLENFGVNSEAVTVIPFGINNSVPNTVLTSSEAKKRLGIEPGTKTILFFGSIRPYKGLEHLAAAFMEIAEHDRDYRLVIAGEPLKGCEEYLQTILDRLDSHPSGTQVIRKTQFVPDDETEVYFKAADVVVLPYVQIFQSGVLFLAYSFGLPAIVANVGSFREDVIEGRTGCLYSPDESGALAATIKRYFQTDLYKELDTRREEIRDRAETNHSWELVGRKTYQVYQQLLIK